METFTVPFRVDLWYEEIEVEMQVVRRPVVSGSW